jgi:hypothetical protein
MKQNQSALGRFSRLKENKKRTKTKKLLFSPPLTSRFLHQIVTSYNKAKQQNLLLHLLPHRHFEAKTPTKQRIFLTQFFIRF